jgi:hypothetical protein
MKLIIALFFALALAVGHAQPTLSGPIDFGPLASDPGFCYILGSRYFNTSTSLTRVCTATGTPGTWGNLGGTGGDTITSPNATLSVGGTSSNTTLDAKTTLIAQKFFGTSAPGSVAGNLPGDSFTDSVGRNVYICGAPTGTAAPACTSVSPAGWLLVTGSRVCHIDNDMQSSTALAAANFSGSCEIPFAATIVQVDVWGGTGVTGGTLTTTGTGSINLQKFTPNGGATTTLLSGALATASGYACALASTSGSCINGLTSSSSVTISTTALSAGDWIRISAATPDSTQTWYKVAITYTVN